MRRTSMTAVIFSSELGDWTHFYMQGQSFDDDIDIRPLAGGAGCWHVGSGALDGL
jgi:hypothetical protein